MATQSHHFREISVLTVVLSGAFTGFCAWLAYRFAWQRDDSMPFWLIFMVFVLSLCVLFRQLSYYINGLKKPSFLILEDDVLAFYVYPTGGNTIPYHHITFIQLTYESQQGGIYNGKIILDFVAEEALLDNPRARDIQQAIVDLKYIDYPNKLSLENQYLLKIQEIEHAIRERCPNVNLALSRQFLLDKEELEAGKRRTREWLDSFKK